MKTGLLNEKRRAAFGWLSKALLAAPFVFAAAFGASILGGSQPAYSATATVTVWNITVPIGRSPDASREDVNGLTGHVNTAANPLTIATVIGVGGGGFVGLIFWNPATNVFVDYGLGFGFADGIDINLTAPR